LTSFDKTLDGEKRQKDFAFLSVAAAVSGAMVSEDDALPDRDEALEFYLRYDVKEVLGRGASSVVRRCVSLESGEAFAVKIIDVSRERMDGDGLDAAEQVHREIHILK
jgi:hypothetical protein